MYEDLSDGVPTPFEDRSFYCIEICFVTMMISIEHVFSIVNRFLEHLFVFQNKKLPLHRFIEVAFIIIMLFSSAP